MIHLALWIVSTVIVVWAAYIVAVNLFALLLFLHVGLVYLMDRVGLLKLKRRLDRALRARYLKAHPDLRQRLREIRRNALKAAAPLIPMLLLTGCAGDRMAYYAKECEKAGYVQDTPEYRGCIKSHKRRDSNVQSVNVL